MTIPPNWLRLHIEPIVLAALVALAGVGPAGGGEPGPLKKGLAASYPGDIGIESHPDVLFTEFFEEASVHDAADRWDAVKDLEIMSLSDDVPPGSDGAASLLLSHVGGQGTGGHLYRQLKPGYDQVYARMYVKFAPDCWDVHHFGTNIGGNRPPTPQPRVSAGNRPPGDDQFWVGVEPGGWTWDFYTYWMEMRTNPNQNFWGNDFINDPDLQVVRDKWISVEVMVKVNTPAEADGELAMWIDGRPWIRDGQVVSHLRKGSPNGKWVWDSWHPDPDEPDFPGFQWRSVPDLNVNYVWLYLYLTKAPEGYVSRVWFDHVVVATSYIGPIE